MYIEMGGETRKIKYLFIFGWWNNKKSGKICACVKSRDGETTQNRAKRKLKKNRKGKQEKSKRRKTAKPGKQKKHKHRLMETSRNI